MTITITDTFSQESVTYQDEDLDEFHSWPPWIWIEGNYACDCNRAIFFDRAKGCEKDLSGYECSRGRFLVKLEQGTDIYDESES